SLRLAPAYRKRLSDLQPDRGIAESLQLFLRQRYRFCFQITGDPSARQGVGTNSLLLLTFNKSDLAPNE
ncbi:hypothetical protein, partial [Enterobacter hormaechei]